MDQAARAPGGKSDGSAKSIMGRLAGRERRVCPGAEGLRLLLERLGGQEQGRLVSLWKNWDQIMGIDVAALGRPLGHKDEVLHIGAENSMALQELSLLAPEILERANAALGSASSEPFTEVRVSLLQGQTGLGLERTPAVHESRHEAGQEVGPGARYAPTIDEGPPIGGLMGKLSPDSPITRCYEAFVRLRNRSLAE